MDQRSMKLMTKTRKKQGGRRLPATENFVEASMQGLEDYIKKVKERLITAASNCNGNKTNRKKGNRNGKKNNCTTTSSDKRARLTQEILKMALKGYATS